MKGLDNKASKLKDLRMKPLIIGLEIKVMKQLNVVLKCFIQ